MVVASWELGIGHRAWALGMGGTRGQGDKGTRRGEEGEEGEEGVEFLLLTPHSSLLTPHSSLFPMPHAQLPITNYLFTDRDILRLLVQASEV